MRPMGTKRPPDQFAASNAARRMDALADLVRDKQIKDRDGATRIYEAFGEYLRAVRAGSPVRSEDHGRVVYGLVVGMGAALQALDRRGPVMVRVIDGDALITWIMGPQGPHDQ